jgi:GntR family transcriptional repressor for pyruvate dehydrogenase complex
MSDQGREADEAARPLRPVRRRNLADDIADSIRSRIFDGTYRPGQKLPPERELARQLKVNRGSLREALKKLQHLGLIRIRQGDGTRVLDFLSTANVDLIKYLFQENRIDRHRLLSDLMEVRTHTCTLIVKLAANRAPRSELEKLRHAVLQMSQDPDDLDVDRAIMIDFEFWEQLAKLGENLVLALMLNTVKPPFRMFKPIFSKLVPAKGTMLEMQAAVLDALLDAQEDEAAETARRYLERGAQLFLDTHRRMGSDGQDLEPEE